MMPCREGLIQVTTKNLKPSNKWKKRAIVLAASTAIGYLLWRYVPWNKCYQNRTILKNYVSV
jgi:hypothetical protein